MGARFAHEDWTEQTPSPEGTCFENGAGGDGEIWAELTAADARRHEANKTDLIVMLLVISFRSLKAYWAPLFSRS